MVFAPQCYGSDGAFDRIGVEINVAIMQKAPEFNPAYKGIRYSIGKPGAL